MDNKLREILKTHFRPTCNQDCMASHFEYDVDQALSAITDLMIEIINTKSDGSTWASEDFWKGVEFDKTLLRSLIKGKS